MDDVKNKNHDNLKDLQLARCTQNIASEIKASPYTRNFVFGNNENNTRLRNKLIAPLGKGRITVLSAMLRYGLNDKRRSDLFPLPHHLGSAKSMRQDQLTLVELAKIVRAEKREEARRRKQEIPPNDPETLKKEFESITTALKGITGRKYSDYANKQNALRVIYLLDRMMNDPKYYFEGREQRFLTFIKLPTKFSFEVRDAHPIPDSTRNTYLLADLKAYIGIEIENETLERIDTFFDTLIDRMNGIRQHLDTLAHLSRKHADVLSSYQTLHALVSSLNITRSVEQEKVDRLDHDLYLHLTRLESLHFFGAYKETIEAAKPPTPIKISWETMVEMLNVITNNENTYPDTTKIKIRIENIPSKINEFSGLFLDFIQHALGFRPDDAAHQKGITLTQEMVYRITCFVNGIPYQREELDVDFRTLTSALCAVAQALEYRTHYRPRVFGNDGMSRSIITPLETPMVFENEFLMNSISEAYYQIWHHRREWVQHALEGSTDVAELKFGLRHAISAKIIECIQLHDISIIESSFDALEMALLSLKPDDLNNLHT